MADEIKISALPAVTVPASTDTLPVVQSGVTKKETVSQVLQGGGAAFGIGTSIQGALVVWNDTNGHQLAEKDLADGQFPVGLTGNGVIAGSFVASTGMSISFNNVNGQFTFATNLLSTANTYTAAQAGAFVTLTDASTVAIDSSLANNFNLTLGGNRTLGFPTNLVAGRSGVINVRQDITGSRTLAYAWCYMFPAGSAPVLSTAALTFDQLNYVVNSYSTSTVTITIASPGVVTWTSHGLVSGQRIQLTTTGALPTGLSASTTYWVTVVNANTFKLSTSLANAQAGTFINTSGSQSGTHTATNASITITINPGIA
jgi:hypothetical protein